MPAFKKGFSLIELLVVIALFSITSIAVTVSYISFEAKEQVKNGALQLKSDLRNAENKAVSGDKISNTSGPCTTTSTPVSGSPITANSLGGWYVYVDNTSPAITYQITGVCLTSNGATPPVYSENSFGNVSYKFPTGVYISCIKYNSGDSCAPAPTHTKAYVFFMPINNTVYFFDQNVDQTDFLDNSTGAPNPTGQLTGGTEIVFTITDGSSSYEVHVNKTGSIYEVKIP